MKKFAQYLFAIALSIATPITFAQDALLDPVKTIKAMPKTSPKEGRNGVLWFLGTKKVSSKEFEATLKNFSRWSKSEKIAQLCDLFRQDIPDPTTPLDMGGNGNVAACLYRINHNQQLMLVSVAPDSGGSSIYMLIGTHD